MSISQPQIEDAQLPDEPPENLDETPEDIGDPWNARPWDPKDIRITSKTFSLREVYLQITDGDLDLAPDFQRSFVWNDAQQVRLIESILLGIPLPAFYFNQEKSGSSQVVDGVQRLTTLKHFMSDNLVLLGNNLEYLKTLAGQKFSTLDPATRKRFAATQIVAHVIEPTTPDEVKYDIFSRVNTGGSPLMAQEIRHCMSKTTSRDFLRRLVEGPSFDAVMGKKFWAKDLDGKQIRNNARMMDREIALRFCAFYTMSLEDYSNSASLDAFLLQFTRKIDQNENTVDLSKLESAFNRAMINTHAILGNNAFRRTPATGYRGPVNKAVFESQAIAFADHDISDLLPFRDELQKSLKALFQNPEYDGAVRFGTGAPVKVHRRISLARDAVARVLP